MATDDLGRCGRCLWRPARLSASQQSQHLPPFRASQDFASYYQAWFLIAHGHLLPYDSIFGSAFLKSHFALLLWPLSCTYWLYPHGVTLLWLQDLAIVGVEIVVLLWALDAMDRHPDLGLPPRVVALVGMVALLVTEPLVLHPCVFRFPSGGVRHAVCCSWRT